MMDKKLHRVFLACKKTSQKGGSYASDSVNGALDPYAFERINVLLSGGGAVLPPLTVAAPSSDGLPGNLSSSFQTSLSQPLAFTGDVNNTATFPSYLQGFAPLLANY